MYVLKSLKTGKHYIGCTSDIDKRLKDHNSGGTKSTKGSRPWKLIYSERFEDKSSAYKREWYLKHPAGYLEKIKIIKESGEIA